jgi:Zn-dependent M28 family amino/carboxypeptidase
MPFNALGLSGVNVIGTRLGTALPNERVIVSAHIDSVPNCRGADDNASGVAGMLETARLMAQQPHARTFVAACWDLEEIDLLGAKAYAQRANTRGETINASVVFDQIGYRSYAPNSQQLPGGSEFQAAFPAAYGELQANQFRGDFISVIADGPGVFSPEGSMSLLTDIERAAAETAVSVIGIAVDDETRYQFEDLLRSDHAAFWQEGYNALLLTDTGPFRNPYYHCPGVSDAPSTLDYELARRVTQVAAQAVRTALNE